MLLSFVIALQQIQFIVMQHIDISLSNCDKKGPTTDPFSLILGRAECKSTFCNSSITDFHMMADVDANGTTNLSPDGKFEFINRNLQVQYPFLRIAYLLLEYLIFFHKHNEGLFFFFHIVIYRKLLVKRN